MMRLPLIEWVRSVLTTQSSRRRRRTSRRDIEVLEMRTLLAAVSDDSGTLQIELSENEQLSIVSHGDSYALASDSSNFTDAGVTDAAVFAGFGTDSLILNDLAAYSSVHITDSASGASLRFNDSGSNTYQHSFVVDLTGEIAGDQAVGFRGASHFGDFDLTIATDRSIHLYDGSSLNTNDGDIRLTALNEGDASGRLRGITLVNASITSTGQGDVVLDGTGTSAGPESDFCIGVSLQDGASISSTADTPLAGSITLNGTGGNGRHSNVGVLIAASSVVSSISGNITFIGDGGSGADWNNGIGFGSSSVIQTVHGHVDIVGTGGTATGSNNHGVHMENFQIIESTGTGSQAGTITISGISGTGAANNGGLVVLGSTPLIRTVDGAVSLTGESAGNTTGTATGGLWLAATVQATGTAAIDIVGSAGTGTVAADFLSGVDIAGTGTRIESNSGPISITGTSSNTPGDFHHGVTIHSEVTVASTDGDITLTGDSRTGSNSHGVSLRGDAASGAKVLTSGSGTIQISATTTGSVDALHLGDKAVLGADSSTGDIILLTDTADVHAAATIQSTGELHIAPRQPGLASSSISLGGANGGGSPDLNLTDSELATLQPGFSSITIGSPELANANSVVAIDTATFHDPVSIYGGSFRDATGTDITAPTTTLSGFISPGQSPGQLNVDGDLRLEENSTLRIEAAGSTPGEGGGFHDQVSSTGRVDIGTNVALQTQWIPTWQAEANDVLVIVSRTGGSGTFAGLPEGATLPEFFNATISYVGGTGDDVVLTLPSVIPQTSVMSLSQPGGSDITIFGEEAGNKTGQRIAGVGDVNGDGYDDVVVSAEHGDAPDGAQDAGRIYLIYGGENLPATVDLANTTVAMTVLYGVDANDQTGHISGGDFNSDGYSDLLIGALFSDGTNNSKGSAGGAYVVWGGPNWGSTIELKNLGDKGVTIYGPDAGDIAGNPLGAVGDINDDGFEDFGLGSIWADSVNNERDKGGETHIILGGDSLPEEIDLATATDGVIRIFGAQAGDESGVAVSRVGDVNGDSVDDLLLAARFADGVNDQTSRAGEAYVIFGGSDFPDSIDLATTGAADVVIYGADVDDFLGWASRGYGDINADGLNDIVLGASGADSINNERRNAGEAFILWGSEQLPSVVDAQTFSGIGVQIYGADKGDLLGRGISIAGDLNGDGYDDLTIGAQTGDGADNTIENAGEVYVIFGRSAFPETLDLAVPGAADQIFFGIDAGDETGQVVRGAGDVNNDGVDDLIIGARVADSIGNGRVDAGEAYVVFGVSVSASPGDVDGSGSFDANDSFLIHLLQLAGTDAQVGQSKGASALTTGRIRDNIAALDPAADVDGDGDFDANDSFLIHLVKLAGTDAQVDQSKGSSSLTAAEIRTRIDALSDSGNRGSGRNSSRMAARKVLASPAVLDGDLSHGTPAVASGSDVFCNRSGSEELFFESASDDQSLICPVEENDEAEATDNDWNRFRSWLDAVM